MTPKRPHTPLVLLILDGWGIREDAADNAITRASTPNWDRLWQDCPHALLETSGTAVGLPSGQMGNSEVGHMNIGAGRIVFQELTRISRAIEDGSFSGNRVLNETIDAADSNTLHLLGLLSPGGVHSHESHFLATLELAAARHRGPIAVHAFLDGRDTPPRSAEPSLIKLERELKNYEQARLASVSGRYWAMDRDERWDRIERAWQAMASARADHHAEDGVEALALAYQRDENDEFVQPTVIGRGAPMRTGDAAIFINFRADRARQLTRVLTDPAFDKVSGDHPELAAVATMTCYESSLAARVAFPPERLERLLGGELAAAGLRQLRIAETEKYAHVTYFLNGGREQVFEGEDRKLIPSPRVATYDLQPEMSAPALTDELVEAIGSERWPVILCNVANPDMVGHTGHFDAALQAVEAVDVLLGRVTEAVDQAGGELLVTADHGNIEQMTDPDSGQPHTAHTLNPVPFVYQGRPATLVPTGSLRDIAPTMLSLLDLEIPGLMTGHSLIEPSTEGHAAP